MVLLLRARARLNASSCSIGVPPFSEWSFPIRTLVGAGRRREIPAILNGMSVIKNARTGEKVPAKRPLVVCDPVY